MNLKNIKFVVIGAGLFGAVIAERIATVLKRKVLIIEKRSHIGGNCFSIFDKDTGIEYHKYGSHIFHTSIKRVWEYLNSFTAFSEYQHKVLTVHRNRIYQVPINLDTINRLYSLNLSPEDAKKFIKSETRKGKILKSDNFEDAAVSLIGRQLYNAFIKGYTIKQWGVDPKVLPSCIISRLPVRYNYNNNYFDDPWQGLPLRGYTELVNRIIKHKNIELRLKVDFFKLKSLIPQDCLIIYTGPLDRFFNYRYGQLEWRTLDFEKKIINAEDFQGVAVMNYADLSVPFTRIHEFRHLHPERKYLSKKTVTYKEYSRDAGKTDEPYYPVRSSKNIKILEKYLEDAKKCKNIIFGGRLGTYEYLDMDKTVNSAIETFENKISLR
jgi:UDP-galactopyranose mutase